MAATENCVTPLPVPLAPLVIVIQASLLVAVHAQPVAVVMSTLPLPPPAAKLCAVGLMANEHPLLFVTVKVCPPTVIVPALCGPELGPTEN